MDFFEFIKDIIDSAKDRIKTPITGSFTLAFIVYNWRPILLLLFSEASIEDKIVVINNEYCCKGAILWPLLIAIFYVIGVPYIMMGLERITSVALFGRKKHKNSQKLIDLELNKDIIILEYENQQLKSNNRDITELNQVIESLQTQLQTSSEQLISTNENYQGIIQNYKNAEAEQRELINELNKRLEETIQSATNDKNTLGRNLDITNDLMSQWQKEYERILQISGIDKVIEKMNDDLKKKFLSLYDLINDSTGDIIIGTYYEDFFVNNHLINKIADRQYKLTPAGAIVAHLITK